MIDPKRVPYGFIVTGGASGNHLTAKTTVEDRRRRADMGETAIKLLEGLGVSLAVLEKLDETSWEKSAAELAAELETLLAPPAAAAPEPARAFGEVTP